MTKKEWMELHGIDEEITETTSYYLENAKRNEGDKHPDFPNPLPPKITAINGKPLDYTEIAYNR
jgi:hypothetical protein